MAHKWTKEQQEAIDITGKLTVLSAAAGSGKTTVLVEKALRLLLDEDNKTAADSLLIATFSNASAKEFKNKIEKGLNKAMKKDPTNHYIKQQKMSLQKADISTIHAFCIKLVRENFEALDIAPDFTICDEARGLVLHDKAIDTAMKHGYTTKNFGEFVALFGKSSQDKQVRDFLKEMYRYFSALPFPIEKAKELSRLLDHQDFKDTEIYKAIMSAIKEQIDYSKYLISREKEIYDFGFFEGYENAIEQDITRAQRLEMAFDQESMQTVIEIARSPFEKLGAAKPKCECSEAIQNIRKRIKEVFGDISENAEYLNKERYDQQKQETTPYIHAMADVFVVYMEELLRLKKEQKTFEFADFEHFAVELLTTPRGESTPLANILKEKYVKIMEDEFQDTSFVQDMIFTSIAKNNEENLFVVGDVKQSIYGFRKASPEILLEKRQRGIDAPHLATTIRLPHNFRSERQVIDAINYVFERIMSIEVGAVDYKDGEQLKAPDSKAATEQIGAEIEIFPQDEPLFVAKKISDMINEGYKIYEDGKERPVTGGDFCILLRNTKRLKEYAKALENRGILAYVKDDELILNKPEVQSVISILRVINNPLQEVYLTAGMFGDLFGFSLDEILEIRLNSRKGNLYKALALSKSERAEGFLATLKDFSAAAHVYSADKLVDYIIKKTGYYSRLALSENGEAKRENLRWFISFAKSYASSYQSSLAHFIRWIDLYIQSGKGTSTAFQRPKNSVAIMTMHTSKGLEFPVCFVSGLATKFNKMDQSKRLMIDTKLGMATFSKEKFGYNTSTAGVKAIREKTIHNLADDEMRLLYVALTRAKNRLILTAQYNNLFTKNTLTRLLERTGKTIHPYAIKKANSPIEWVLMGYLDHPAICDDTLSRQNNKAGDFLKFEIIDSEIELEEVIKEKVTHTPSTESLEKMEKGFLWQYKDIAKTKLPIKLSVGEIAKAPPPVILPKPFFAREQTATAAQRGSAMHRFAQHTDILLARANIENEIERLQNLNLIEKELINIPQIQVFLKSDVAARILNGDKIYTEKEFLVPFNAQKALKNAEYEGETVLVQGVMDCVVLNKTSAVVIDYKTDRVHSMDELYSRYKEQLEMYRYAVGYLFEITDIKCIIYSFTLGTYLEF